MKKQLSWSIIKRFSSRNKFGFTMQDVAMEFPQKNRGHLARILADMVDNGMLFKINRDTYHIIPLHANPQTYVPDGLQLAKYIMQNKEYYIGYASAMKIHGLSLQSEAREYVVTNKQMKPAVISIGAITCQFIQHYANRFFGFSSIWINQLERAMVSDREKTIVDAATKPHLCGGIIEVGNALIRTKDQIDHDKLFYYFSRNMNKSAKKRFLYLIDLLDLEWTAEHERLMEELGAGITLLDPSEADQGKRIMKFGLKINVDPILIKEKVLAT